MVKRDAFTSRSSDDFLDAAYPSAPGYSPGRAQVGKPVFNRPGAALCGTQTFPSVRRTDIPAPFFFRGRAILALVP
jgi:hypothetical protein